MPDLKTAIARFGADAKAKLSNPSATGEPENQLRAPLEALFGDLAELCQFKRELVVAVGESSLSTLHTRPDFAITVRNALVGFVEVKAPGKGADPRRYKGRDKERWEKLQSLRTSYTPTAIRSVFGKMVSLLFHPNDPDTVE